jgi:hypothetical protein
MRPLWGCRQVIGVRSSAAGKAASAAVSRITSNPSMTNAGFRSRIGRPKVLAGRSGTTTRVSTALM